MILEIAQIEILPGHNAAFEAAVEKAVPVFQASKGCRGCSLYRSFEQPDRYRLIVRWESVEAHTEDFRNSDNFRAWRALVGEHFATPPSVEHVEVAVTGFGQQP